VPRAPVGPGGRAGRHDQLPHPVEADRRLGYLGQLGRRLRRDRGARVERFLDRAEPAPLVLRVPDAGLHDRGGEHVPPVQQGDLAVGDPVRGGQIVKFRPNGRVRLYTEIDPAPVEPAIGDGVRAGRIDRQRRVAPVEPQVPVVARAGPLAALNRGLDPDSGQRELHPHSQVKSFRAYITHASPHLLPDLSAYITTCRWS
jgi:hypothetical protein